MGNAQCIGNRIAEFSPPPFLMALPFLQNAIPSGCNLNDRRPEMRHSYKLLATILALAATPALAMGERPAEDLDFVISSNPLGPHCVSKRRFNYSFEKWMEITPVIFRGRVEEISLTPESYKIVSNSCWANVNVQETFKGTHKDRVWVEVYYDPYDHEKKHEKHMPDIKNCRVEADQDYLIFGREFQADFGSGKTAYISTAIPDEGSHADCYPVLTLPDHQTALDKVRHLNLGGNYDQQR